MTHMGASTQPSIRDSLDELMVRFKYDTPANTLLREELRKIVKRLGDVVRRVTKRSTATLKRDALARLLSLVIGGMVLGLFVSKLRTSDPYWIAHTCIYGTTVLFKLVIVMLAADRIRRHDADKWQAGLVGIALLVAILDLANSVLSMISTFFRGDYTPADLLRMDRLTKTQLFVVMSVAEIVMALVAIRRYVVTRGGKQVPELVEIINILQGAQQ